MNHRLSQLSPSVATPPTADGSSLVPPGATAALVPVTTTTPTESPAMSSSMTVNSGVVTHPTAVSVPVAVMTTAVGATPPSVSPAVPLPASSPATAVGATPPSVSPAVPLPASSPAAAHPAAVSVPVAFTMTAIGATPPSVSPAVPLPASSTGITHPSTVSVLTTPPVSSTGITHPATVASVLPPPGVFPTSTHFLPQIQPYYGGDQRDGETFQDWLEHFEAVALLARWDDHYKLVHLTTSLRSMAKSFFRSCLLAQQNNYTQLVAELKKQFTPIQLPAIKTQMFHDRKQGPRETVDDFAQELRKLYAKAYAAVTRGTPEAEQVGQTVLANQFVAGLRPELQTKVVGTECVMERLVLKARFEEAKSKELTAAKSLNSTPKRMSGSTPSRTGTSTSNSSGSLKQTTKTSTREKSAERNGRKCYN